TKNSGTRLASYIVYFTKTIKIPGAHSQNVELIGVHIGGSADLKIGAHIKGYHKHVKSQMGSHERRCICAPSVPIDFTNGSLF
ncbi:MAG: hypothetical protein ACKPKO_01605, partial [Candidatus Fonsibacter sp.]